MSGDTTSDPIGQRPQRDAGVPHFYLACRRCGGAVRPGRLRCSQCSSDELSRRPASESPSSISPRRTPAIGSNANQFSIETLLLVTTLAAVCLGLIAANHAIGLVVTILSAAALIRTIFVARHRMRQGLGIELTEKIGSFVISLLIVLGAIIASIAALFVAAFAGSVVDQTFLVFGARSLRTFVGAFIALGVISAAIGAGIDFLWFTRPR